MKQVTKFGVLILGIIIVSITVYKNGIPNHKTGDNVEQDTETKTEGDQSNMTQETNKINISINGIDYSATLEDNDTANEFLNKLPLTITLTELNGNEKYYYFDETFTNHPTKIGQIHTGDLMLYGNDCFVLFYETFQTSYSYTKIGKMDDPKSLKNNVGTGSVEITITK